MGVYEPLPPLERWEPMDIARNIVNVLFEQAEVSVVRRQALNDQCDGFVSDLLTRWEDARRDRR